MYAEGQLSLSLCFLELSVYASVHFVICIFHIFKVDLHVVRYSLVGTRCVFSLSLCVLWSSCVLLLNRDYDYGGTVMCLHMVN